MKNFKFVFSLVLFFSISIFSITYSKDLSNYGFDSFKKLDDSFHQLKKEMFNIYSYDDEIIDYSFTIKFFTTILNDFKECLEEDIKLFSGFSFDININSDSTDSSSDSFECFFDYSDSLSVLEPISQDILDRIFVDKSDDSSNVIIFGDLHGNYNDFSLSIKNLITRNIISEKLVVDDNYKILFLGDYIDRGNMSLQNLIFIMLLKIINKKRVFTLRGNHETDNIPFSYGFRVELERFLFGKPMFEARNFLDKQNENINITLNFYNTFTSVFDYLPIFYVLDRKKGNYVFSHSSMPFSGKELLNASIDKLLWSDIYICDDHLFDRKMPNVIAYHALELLKINKDSGNIKTFSGHNHIIKKQIEQINDYDFSPGFINLGNDDIGIYIIISCSCMSGDIVTIQYSPSYLELNIKNDVVKGWSMDDDGNFSDKDIPCNSI